MPPISTRPRSTKTFATRDIHGQSIRSPILQSIAGSSVIDAAIDTSVTKMAPAASARKIVVGMMNMPSSASTTVIPEKNTARLAVAPEAPIASSLSKPFFRSSR